MYCKYMHSNALLYSEGCLQWGSCLLWYVALYLQWSGCPYDMWLYVYSEVVASSDMWLYVYSKLVAPLICGSIFTVRWLPPQICGSMFTVRWLPPLICGSMFTVRWLPLWYVALCLQWGGCPSDMWLYVYSKVVAPLICGSMFTVRWLPLWYVALYSRIPLSRAPLTRGNQLVALAPWTPKFSDSSLAAAHMTEPVTHMCWSEQISPLVHSSQATWQPFNLSHCIEMHNTHLLRRVG